MIPDIVEPEHGLMREYLLIFLVALAVTYLLAVLAREPR